MGVTQAEDDDLMARAAAGEITDAQGQAELLMIYKSRGDISRQSIMSAVTQYTYVDGARELVNSLRAKGYKVVLVSGAMDILVEHVANELGIDTWRASNRFIFESDQLVNIEAPKHEDRDKAQQFRSICTQSGIDPTDCVAVGDGASDTELFRLTQHGITFPGSPIEAEAWKVVKDLSEIDHLF